jgi:hypothetical protein
LLLTNSDHADSQARAEPAQPLEIKIVNADQIGRIDKAMKVSRDSDGKLHRSPPVGGEPTLFSGRAATVAARAPSFPSGGFIRRLRNRETL